MIRSICLLSVAFSAFMLALPSAATEVEPCLALAAQEFNVPVEVLDAIRKEESTNRPKNPEFSRREHGPMNLSHIVLNESQLHAAVNASKAISDPCENYRVASWFLARALRDEKGDIWKAVRTYYAGPKPTHRVAKIAEAYVERIKQTVAASATNG